MRIGEILLRQRRISKTQLQTALGAQKSRGARIGTNLIDCGFATIDDITAALAIQHQVPGAMSRHLSKIDKGLLILLSQQAAARFHAFPLAAPPAPQPTIVCVMRDPYSKATVRSLEQVIGNRVVPAVMAEVGLFRKLNQYYKIPLPPRYEDKSMDISFDADSVNVATDKQTMLGMSPLSDIPKPKTMTNQGFTLTTLDDDLVEKDLSSYSPRGTMQLASPLDLAKAPQSTTTKESAQNEIGSASTRDDVIKAILSYCKGRFDHSLFLVVRGDSLQGHMASGITVAPSSIYIAKETTTMFAPVWMQGATLAPRPITRQASSDAQFCSSLNLIPPRQYVIVPITLAKKNIAVLYADFNARSHPGVRALADLNALVTSAGTRFTELIKQAKRGK